MMTLTMTMMMMTMMKCMYVACKDARSSMLL